MLKLESLFHIKKCTCELLLQTKVHLFPTKGSQKLVNIFSQGLGKLDNIVGEHFNHNVGRMLVDFSCCS